MLFHEAEKVLDSMKREDLIQLVRDHYKLKQHLCAQTLVVPTGCDDWMDRAIERAAHLRECEIQLRKVIDGCGLILSDAKWATKKTVCTNCRGTGIVQGDSCCICRGTGALSF